MLGRVCVACGAISLLFSAATVAAQPPLEPIGKWDLDYGEAQCIAVRDYGSAENPISFAIRPAPNGETFELLIARKTSGPRFAQELEGSVDFGGGPNKAWLLHYELRTKNLDVYQFRISAVEMAEARSAHAVTLRIKGAPDFAFELDSIPQLLDGLDACTADLKRYWNIDDAKQAKQEPVGKSARGDVRTIFTANDYPTEASSRHQQGQSQFLLLVDEKGHVAGCHVVVASGVPALDAMGCQVISGEGEVHAATDNSGKPVRSSVITPPIRWQMEG